MDLLSVDIAKVKRLPLLEAKVTAPEVKGELIDKHNTEEERAYSKLIAINPFIEDLVKGLDLVSSRTGERINKTETKDQRKVNKPQLLSVAKKIIDKENNYSKEEIINKLKGETKGDHERAEKGFNLMVEAGVIEATPGDRYYLTGSTPF